jgi:hypothetical protein
MTYEVAFQSPEWCYGGLDPATTDFSVTPEDSMSGYKSANGLTRRYSRLACESLGLGKGYPFNVWNANGECVPILAADGNSYNASLVCAGLNDISLNSLLLPIAEFDIDCPPKEDKLGWILLSVAGGLLLGFLVGKYSKFG